MSSAAVAVAVAVSRLVLDAAVYLIGGYRLDLNFRTRDGYEGGPQYNVACPTFDSTQRCISRVTGEEDSDCRGTADCTCCD